MSAELRTSFHQHLGQIDEAMVRLFAIVTEGIGAATEVLLTGEIPSDFSAAHQEEVVGTLWLEVEETAQRLVLLEGPVSTDLRFLLTVLRIAPELERSADLATHIGERAGASISTQLTPKMRGLIDRMGGHAVAMWRRLSEAYVERDSSVASVLEDVDNEMDRLHHDLCRELEAASLPPAVLMDMTLVARFFERLGDHAVNIARRFAYLSGQSAA